MLLNALQVLTSVFLVFAGTYFIYGGFKSKNNWSGLISNLVCAGFMVSALAFIWR